MITCFPAAFPNELLLSLLARCQRRLKFPSTRNFLKEILGTTWCPAVDFPFNLQHLTNMITSEYGYTADDFIDHHTLLPVYFPFLYQAQIQSLREFAKMGMDAPQRRATPLLLRRRIPTLVWLRICPGCYEEDTTTFGEPYWHREHQYVFLKTCVKHQLFLQDSSVYANGTSPYQQLITLREIPLSRKIQRLDFDNLHHRLHHSIASDVVWIINNFRRIAPYESLHTQYMVRLIYQGFANQFEILDKERLQRTIADQYPPDFLNDIHNTINNFIYSDWLSNVLDRNAKTFVLHHLLFMHALGYTAESFFTQRWYQEPFGRGYTSL